MTKAEEKSIVYQLATHGPRVMGGSAILSENDSKFWNINYDFKAGYEEAEKDLALTWEDMKLVIAAEGSIYDDHHGNSDEVFEAYPTEEEFYREVLRRFQELKAEKENERPTP